MNLMDYSLLIGIHDCDRAYMEAEQEQQEENGATGTNVSVAIYDRIWTTVSLFVIQVHKPPPLKKQGRVHVPILHCLRL